MCRYLFTLNKVYWIVLPLIAFVAYMYLDVSTSKLVMTQNELTFFHMWKIKWKCQIDEIRLSHELGGDFGVLPVLVFKNVHSRKRIGFIKKTYFSSNSIKEIEDWILAAKSST